MPPYFKPPLKQNNGYWESVDLCFGSDIKFDSQIIQFDYFLTFVKKYSSFVSDSLL